MVSVSLKEGSEGEYEQRCDTSADSCRQLVGRHLSGDAVLFGISDIRDLREGLGVRVRLTTSFELEAALDGSGCSG
jgi:hypothetical protein